MKGLGPTTQGVGYLTGDVAGLLKVSPRRVEGWIEQGFIKPAVPGKGPGRRNLFTLEHVFLGALLLEVQANFGEKSALVGRLFPDVAEALVRISRRLYANRGKDAVLVLGVSARAGGVAHFRILPQRLMMDYLTKGMNDGHTVTFINVHAIFNRFFEKD